MELWIMLLGVLSCLVFGLIAMVSGQQQAKESSGRSPREIEDLLEAVMSCSRDAIVVLDSQGRVVVWSKTAQSVLGWSEKQVLGRKLPEILQCSDLEKCKGAESPKIVEMVAPPLEGKRYPLSFPCSG